MQPDFQWPDGKRAAVSLSFDDARISQVETGLPILDSFDVRATFYLGLWNVPLAPDAWRAAAARGHEIGNHTINHPCTGNFSWCKVHLEVYTLEHMEQELTGAQDAIRQAIGVTPTTFAYPCGNKFVGRGEATRSYVPLVSRHFLAGRGFRDETPNLPAVCDLAQVAGVDADRYPFETLKGWIDRTVDCGGWLCFVNHDVSPTLPQGITPDTLKRLCAYLAGREDVWVDTIANVASHLSAQRSPTPGGVTTAAAAAR
jgi:peptidoglycan/xylan/chitin deacetylase (PgdA/CDA1 family)